MLPDVGSQVFPISANDLLTGKTDPDLQKPTASRRSTISQLTVHRHQERVMAQRLFALAGLGVLLMSTRAIYAADGAPLELEAKIPLGEVHGRIDHLTYDSKRQRLFVAELGNNSIGVVDLTAKKTIRTIAGIDEPQGLAYNDATDTLYAASGGDGSLHLFAGDALNAAAVIKLGSDADNVRVDRTARQIIVGYGGGALAVIDADSRKVIATIPLKGHPESFQLDPNGTRIVINVPNAHEIAVVDRVTNKQIASFPGKELAANYPLALDIATQLALTVFRRPATLGIFSLADGHRSATVEVCGDSDDVFLDAKRQRVYVICGDGFVDVLAQKGESFQQVARVKTVDGARTGLFVADLDRLFVAVRARGGEAAAIWVFRPPS
jgi:DNA-binding beta-propeller fold protein YncE